MRKTHTIVMFSIESDKKRAYLYLHRQEIPVKKGKSVKIQFHPLSVVYTKTKGVAGKLKEKRRRSICRFVASYGIKNFTIHNHELSQDLHLVQIHSGFPQKGEDVFNLMPLEKALSHFSSEDHLAGGIDHIEVIRETMEKLMAKTTDKGTEVVAA
jgi:hypothetical protein